MSENVRSKKTSQLVGQQSQLLTCVVGAAIVESGVACIEPPPVRLNQTIHSTASTVIPIVAPMVTERFSLSDWRSPTSQAPAEMHPRPRANLSAAHPHDKNVPMMWYMTQAAILFMPKLNLTNIVLAILSLFDANAGAQTTHSDGKKLIEFGWDEPDTAFIQKHIAEMEQTPFDGTVFHITYEKPDGSRGNFMNSVWSDRRFTFDELKRSDDELSHTPFKRFTQNFLRFNVVPGDVDWFDDFDAVKTNAFLAAKVARDGKCRGILFDIESYDKHLWDYAKQENAATRSWDDYGKQARDRGRLLMSSFQDGFGDGLVVFMTFGFSLPDAETGGDLKKLPQVKYGLLRPFIEGMLDAARPDSTIVDGYEVSYGYRDAKQFTDAEKSVHERLAGWSDDPETYRKTISLGFGLWMDFDWRKNGWNAADFSKNYFTPEQFEKSVGYAMKGADEFVWIYTEEPRWWSENGRVKLPDEYVRAIESAKMK
jgi:hypothetical protein